jgi:hypothetical protein
MFEALYHLALSFWFYLRTKALEIKMYLLKLEIEWTMRELRAQLARRDAAIKIVQQHKDHVQSLIP